MAQKSITSFFKPLTPKVPSISESPQKRPASNDTPPIKKPKLSDESSLQSKLNSMCKTNKALSSNMGLSWFKALLPEFNKDYFKKLGSFIESERSLRTIYPPHDQVYSWTRMCTIDEVKVVILGQDPYHGPKQAHGLCFSVLKPVIPPPSLKNMYNELKNDLGDFKIPSHGDLTGWAKQGVLLLNAVLTVRASEANSHVNKGWEKLTDAVMKYLNLNRKNLVFLLWGSFAHKKGAIIDTNRHLVLKCAHPSPLSAHLGFFGCKHFSRTNEYLKMVGKDPIDWNDLP